MTDPANTAYRLTHIPTNIVVFCQNERSQHKNRASARKVLKSRLFDLKIKENQAKLDTIAGAKKEIGFGSQIRSYVLQCSTDQFTGTRRFSSSNQLRTTAKRWVR